MVIATDLKSSSNLDLFFVVFSVSLLCDVLCASNTAGEGLSRMLLLLLATGSPPPPAPKSQQ